MKQLTALIILDGFGYRQSCVGNAIAIDGVPNIAALLNNNPHTLLGASGGDVGLPEGQMGNSEVGHLNIGAGRIVLQALSRINNAIADGSFFDNAAFHAALSNCKRNNSALHLFGLCSNGGVHSHLNHLYALLTLAKREGLERVYIHCFTDGRDVPPQSGAKYIIELQNKISEIGCGKIATVMGRYYAMDRDKRFDRVQKAYDAMVYGNGIKCSDPVKAVESSYASGITDEFIVPVVITDSDGLPTALIEPNDSIICFNFRPDRAREITEAFIYRDFAGFNRSGGYFPVFYVCMTQYNADFDKLVHIAFAPERYCNTLGEYLSKCGKTQLRIAETEKYAHVTFFFNGGVEAPNPGEDRVLVPSPKVATYDLQPQMSAFDVTDEAISRIQSREYDFMVLNFANTDMVGHTGVLDAAVKAVHAVDVCVGRLVKAILSAGGSCIITADHGNCEQMLASDGSALTEHTTNPVPFIYVGSDSDKYTLLSGGKLCDIAPTLLSIMGLPIPAEMSGHNLIKLNQNGNESS